MESIYKMIYLLVHTIFLNPFLYTLIFLNNSHFYNFIDISYVIMIVWN